MIQQLKSRYRKLAKLARFSSAAIREYGFRFFITSALLELKKYKLEVFAPEAEPVKVLPISAESAYRTWLQDHQITPEIESVMKQELQTFSHKLKLTIIISVEENTKHFLSESLLSISSQMYDNWEVHLACSTSLSKDVDTILKTMSGINSTSSRIKQENSLKNAVSSASGNFIVFVKCGTVLTQDAFFRMIQFLNGNMDADIIYSDEDQITASSSRTNPFFKPDWSPNLFLSFDYISNFYIVKQNLFDSIEINEECKEAKHYDLLLKLTEKTKKILHIPTVLASVRNDGSSNNYENAQKALSEALIRRGIKGKVTNGLIPRTFRVTYLLEKEPKVSIIIPTRDNKYLLNRCITNIRKKTLYKNYEIIIIDNNSTKEETLSYLKSLPYTIIKYESQFNFSKMNNLAASHASGEYLLFLNDDTAPLESNWLSEMVSICQQNEIGAVGAKLVHGNNTIQHAGIVMLKTGAGFHPMQNVDANKPGYFGFLNVIRDCSAVTGACLLIKKKLFEKIGGFDDNYDLYYGDTDLCLNVRKHGYAVVYTPYAVLLHQGSSKIKEYATAFFTVENHQYFVKKWPIWKEGDPFYNPNLTFDYRIDLGDNTNIEKEMHIDKQQIKEQREILIKKYTEFLDSTYKELLLRPVDTEGLSTYLSMLTSKKLTMDQVRNMISESYEAKNIQSFSHYSDKYWNDLDKVNSYLNKLSTGDEKINWMEDMMSRFKQYLPFKKVLIVGCGNGWLERRLYDLGIGLEFDAFDVSEQYLETAKKERGNRPINYFVSDVNNMENIENSKYDAVFNFAILHHATEIEYATKKLAQVLKSNGLMFNWEYVGPSRNQYTDEHLKIMEEVMSRLPKRLQSKHRLRPAIENFRVEPTEAIHSDLVRPMFRKYFDCTYERDLNGGIAYQILWNNIDGFKNKSDNESNNALKLLLDEDLKLSKNKKVPVLFWYGVGKPKQVSS